MRRVPKRTGKRFPRGQFSRDTPSSNTFTSDYLCAVNATVLPELRRHSLHHCDHVPAVPTRGANSNKLTNTALLPLNWYPFPFLLLTTSQRHRAEDARLLLQVMALNSFVPSGLNDVFLSFSLSYFLPRSPATRASFVYIFPPIISFDSLTRPSTNSCHSRILPYSM